MYAHTHTPFTLSTPRARQFKHAEHDSLSPSRSLVQSIVLTCLVPAEPEDGLER